MTTATKPDALAILKQMSGVNTKTIAAQLKAQAQVKALVATTTAMPADKLLLGMDGEDDYQDGLKLSIPGSPDSISLDDLVAFAKQGMNIHFHGKKGTGKSRLIRELVKRLNMPTIEENRGIFEENKLRVAKDEHAKLDPYIRLPYYPYTYGCHEETLADDLLFCADVEYDDAGNKKSIVHPGALILAWAKEYGGGCCILEEIDCVMPGRMIACHVLLDGQTNVYKSFIMGERTFTKYENFLCLASSNTRGSGESARLYAGTQIQNSALMSRFSLSFEVGFLPEAIEEKYLTKNLHVPSDAAKMMVSVANQIRTSPSIEEGISIRDLRNWAIAGKAFAEKRGYAMSNYREYWNNALRLVAHPAFVTRCADQSTRDAMANFLRIV